MKNAPLIIAIVLIIGVIVLFESTKTKTELSINSTINVTAIKEKENKYPKAIEIVNPSGFVNINEINITNLIGKKVILVDFWTYSCINCQRTLPYLNAWYDKYKSQGLEIISIHTPEFEFEKDIRNVKTAVSKFNIKYPVVLDNNYATWSAYKNQYWPRKYLIDIDGYIVYDHIGEGDYDETEQVIQNLLIARQQKLNSTVQINRNISKPNTTFTAPTAPVTRETYLGAARNSYLGNGNPGELGIKTFELPQTSQIGSYYLTGTWNTQTEYIECISNCSLIYPYFAKNVFLVASSENQTSLLIKTQADNATIKIKDSTLYTLVKTNNYESNVVELLPEAGFKAYAFTFG